MTLHSAYDPDNIFAKILRGDIPHIGVYEDEIALAFMDIFPQTYGHTLIIPKQVRARNLLDVPSEKLGPYMERVQRVAIAVEKALKPDGLIITQFNGSLAGQTVFHLHFHILPKFTGARLKPHAEGAQADPADLEKLAERIRLAF